MQSPPTTPAPRSRESGRDPAPRQSSGRKSNARRPTPATLARGAAAGDERDACCEVQVVHLAQVARARAALPGTGALDTSAALLRSLGDRTRLQIVVALAAAGELCVCDLAAVVGVSQSAVSHSLRTLRQLGVVGYRKDAQIAYYALDQAWRASPLGDLIAADALWPRDAAPRDGGSVPARAPRRRSA